MNSLQFRARLIDPGDKLAERPKEIYATTRAEIDRWAAEVLKKAVSETAAVNVYQSVEQHVALITKPKPPAPEAK